MEGLLALAGKEIVKINPKDAFDFGIEDQEMVSIVSRNGKTEMEARITDTVRPGVIIIHYSSSEEKINALFEPGLDPSSKTPEMKACPVRITRPLSNPS